MPNKIIKIGGESRPVNFGRSFWGEVEKITNKSVLELILKDSLNFTYVGSAIVYSALKWGLYDSKKGLEPMPEFTQFKVDEWIDDDKEVILEFYKEMIGSLPLPNKKKEEIQNQSTG